MWDESIGIDLESRFGVIGEFLIFKDLVFLDLLKFFFLIFFLHFNSIGYDFILAIGVDMRVEDNERVDILKIVGYTT